MMTSRLLRASQFRTNQRTATVELALVFLLALTLTFAQSATAQTFKVLYNFSGGTDGGQPMGTLAMDKTGSLYGTTAYGGLGSPGNGTVFKLRRFNSSWLFSPIWTFAGGNDGILPYSGVSFGPDGSLYGTTYLGGGTGCTGLGCGTVFNLKPASTACRNALCSWNESVLYRFTGVGNDGLYAASNVVFDTAGNVYGTTYVGGGGCGTGTAYELTPSGSDWNYSLLHQFDCGLDGGHPYGGVVLDANGDLYGTAESGGSKFYGVIWRITP